MNDSRRPRFNQKVARDWILFLCGIVWISYFAFIEPAAMNPYFMTLGAGALFGPGVVNLWKTNDEDPSKRP